ncbi:hypothetical protein BU17DRAFT_52307 [Hysterangium stoloniferum]|nr:hypothetical protein BU17DRAFT_52307 [Hysterangium stoloniferum]
MSCLLYDLAIELLGNLIRKSKKLKEFKLKGIRKIIVKMFAVDTLIYMCKMDKWSDLQDIIKKFCCASTAVFNAEKTELLPIRSKEHRNETVTNRMLGGDKLLENVKIAKDGKGIRTLGAWIGNRINVEDKWDKILEKCRNITKVWKASFLSLTVLYIE